MNDTDKRAFADSITALGLVFGLTVEKPLLAAYWQFLHGLDLQVFLVAVEMAGRTLKWFPKPAELLDLAGAGAPARKTEIASAWEAVMQAISRYGYVQTVDFGPLVNAVIRNMGGWQRLCDRNEREMVWERKKFEEVCELFMGSGAELRGAPLPGMYYPNPVRIPIGGRLPPIQVEATSASTQDLVRQLAESKSAERTS